MTDMGKEKERPKMELAGHDGNIFAILGRASRLLKEHGFEDDVEKMWERVKQSHSYHAALHIISEYVETEISDQGSSEERLTKEKTKKRQLER